MAAPTEWVLQFGTASEHVRLAFPDSMARAGAGAIRAEILLPQFRGQISPWIEFENLQSFTSSLRALYNDLAGRAELRPQDEQLVLHFEAQPAGHIHLHGQAWAVATHGSCLSFELALDQSFLLGPLQTLETMLRR